jgi:hypothetical protein
MFMCIDSAMKIKLFPTNLKNTIFPENTIKISLLRVGEIILLGKPEPLYSLLGMKPKRPKLIEVKGVKCKQPCKYCVRQRTAIIF